MQVGRFVHIDTHQPSDSEQKKVLAIRYENIPKGASDVFSKLSLTRAIQSGDMGFNNVTKGFSSKREKCSLILLEKLPEDVVKEVIQGEFLLAE